MPSFFSLPGNNLTSIIIFKNQIKRSFNYPAYKISCLFSNNNIFSVGAELTCQCKRCGFNPWVRKIPWNRKWQPTPVFLTEKFHGQRNMAGYSPWDCEELDTTEQSTATIVTTVVTSIMSPLKHWQRSSPWPNSNQAPLSSISTRFQLLDFSVHLCNV